MWIAAIVLTTPTQACTSAYDEAQFSRDVEVDAPIWVDTWGTGIRYFDDLTFEADTTEITGTWKIYEDPTSLRVHGLFTPDVPLLEDVQVRLFGLRAAEVVELDSTSVLAASTPATTAELLSVDILDVQCEVPCDGVNLRRIRATLTPGDGLVVLSEDGSVVRVVPASVATIDHFRNDHSGHAACFTATHVLPDGRLVSGNEVCAEENLENGCVVPPIEEPWFDGGNDTPRCSTAAWPAAPVLLPWLALALARRRA